MKVGPKDAFKSYYVYRCLYGWVVRQMPVNLVFFKKEYSWVFNIFLSYLLHLLSVTLFHFIASSFNILDNAEFNYCWLKQRPAYSWIVKSKSNKGAYDKEAERRPVNGFSKTTMLEVGPCHEEEKQRLWTTSYKVNQYMLYEVTENN